MRSRITKIIIVVVVLSLVAFGLIFGGKITSIIVNGDFSIEPQLKISAEKCLQQFEGRSMWLLSENSVRSVILRCESMFQSVTIHNSFPGKLIVDLIQVQPVVKIEKEDKSCVLIQDSSKKILTTTERCSLYILPVLKGIEVEQNVFVQDYAVTLIKTFSENNFTVKTIELSGDKIAPWYHIILDNQTHVYLSSATNLKEKVAILRASVNGLNTAKERYSTIDLRFDMVTYK